MPLQITEFNDMTSLQKGVAQVASGVPIAVSVAALTGLHTVNVKTRLIKISGSGTILWAVGQEPETFSGVEFRGVSPSQQFTVA